jgi:hypothetical protein
MFQLKCDLFYHICAFAKLIWFDKNRNEKAVVWMQIKFTSFQHTVQPQPVKPLTHHALDLIACMDENFNSLPNIKLFSYDEITMQCLVPIFNKFIYHCETKSSLRSSIMNLIHKLVYFEWYNAYFLV